MRALSSRNQKSSNSSSRGASSRGAASNHIAPRAPRDASGVRYDVLDRVGEGTLFVVYRVRDKNSDRILALKALKNQFNAHPQFSAALAQNAVDSSLLSHPFLARVVEVGREDGTLFLLQEWLPGQSLEARLRRAPFGRIEAVSSTRQIAEALQYLHENGATHGDLRPRQILSAGDGSLKLTDFGLSEAFRAAGFFSADVLHDAVGYMAPELGAATGREVASATPASDLYALGVILYRMLAGRAPFDGPSMASVAMRHRNDMPLPPSKFNPLCPPDLEEIALRLLQKEPSERFASANDLLDALNGAAPSNATMSAAQNAIKNPPPKVSAPVAPITKTPQEEALVARTIDSAALAATTLETEIVAAPRENQFNDSKTQPLPNPDFESSDVVVFAANPEIASITESDVISSTRNVPEEIAPATIAPAPSLFPASMPISDIANAALSRIGTSIPASPIPATSSSAVSSTPKTAVSLAGVTSISAPPTLPPTPLDLAADAEIERKDVKKHRRREAWSAVRAFVGIWLAVGILGGIVYGSYRWWVNAAPHDVTVPSYLGLNEDAARQMLQKRGLEYSEVGEVYDPKRPAGTILRGFPAPGKTVKPGRIIGVTVSRGAQKEVMPDLSELDLAHVRQILQRAGLRLGNISMVYHDTIAKGYICGQYPLPGDSFSRSEPINLILSRGPQAAVKIPATQLPPPPLPPDTAPPGADNSPPVSGNDAPSSDPLAAPPSNPNAPDPNSTVPLVTRTVLIRVPVPAKAGATTRDVKIVARDAGGEHTVYEQSHAPGELVDEYVQITRAQGSVATILIYIDDVLQKQQRV